MPLPTQMSLRRFPEALRPKVRIAYAAAWEALVETHAAQALQFVQEFANRLPVLEALDLYFEVVAVPSLMEETVKIRTLTRVDLDTLEPPMPLPSLNGWQLLRMDLVIKTAKHRRRLIENIREHARMSGARAAEAVVMTHVRNALLFAQLLHGLEPIESAMKHYIQEFSLSLPTAQSVLQRAQAAVARRRTASQSDRPSGQQLAPAPAPPERVTHGE
jgi:hypothetical protein